MTDGRILHSPALTEFFQKLFHITSQSYELSHEQNNSLKIEGIPSYFDNAKKKKFRGGFVPSAVTRERGT